MPGSRTVHPHVRSISPARQVSRPRGCRAACVWCQEGKVTATGLATRDVMSTEVPALPLTVTHLPVTGCQIRHRTACRPATPSQVLTGHYSRPIPKRLAASPGPACSCRTTPTLFQVLRKNGAEHTLSADAASGLCRPGTNAPQGLAGGCQRSGFARSPTPSGCQHAPHLAENPGPGQAQLHRAVVRGQAAMPGASARRSAPGDPGNAVLASRCADVHATVGVVSGRVPGDGFGDAHLGPGTPGLVRKLGWV